MNLFAPNACCKSWRIIGMGWIDVVDLRSPLAWENRCLSVYYPNVCMLIIYFRIPLHCITAGLVSPFPYVELVGLICRHPMGWSQQGFSLSCFLKKGGFF